MPLLRDRIFNKPLRYKKAFSWIRICCFCVFLAAIPASQAQTSGGLVIPASRRVAAIEAGDALLSSNSVSLSEIQGLETPFLFPDQIAQLKGTTQVAPQKHYSDADVVKAVGKSIEPLGSLVAADGKQWLYLKEGRLSAGQVFRVLVQGTPYEITLESVSEESFTLRLNEASWTQPVHAINSQQVHFDN